MSRMGDLILRAWGTLAPKLEDPDHWVWGPDSQGSGTDHRGFGDQTTCSVGPQSQDEGSRVKSLTPDEGP